MMDKIADLVEQHIRESESRLRHIDELMARARQAVPAGAGTDAVLAKIQLDRDRHAQALDAIRRVPPGNRMDVAEQGAGLRGALEALGLQLEQMLAAVFEKDGR